MRGDLRVQPRHGRERKLQRRFRPLDVETGASTCRQTIFRQPERLALDVGIPQRDGELRLRAAQLEVRPRDFRREAYS